MAQNRGYSRPLFLIRRPDIQAVVPGERGHLGGTVDNYVCAIVRKITFRLIRKMHYKL